MSVVLGVRVAPLVGFDFDNFTTDNINSDRIAGRLADGANEDARFVGPCGIVSLAQGLVVCDERDGRASLHPFVQLERWERHHCCWRHNNNEDSEKRWTWWI